MMRRIVAIGIISALLILLAPIKITVSSASALVEDPLNTAIAPHFSRVVYTLTEPEYSTACDERGDFKALVGAPVIDNEDSRLTVTPTSTVKASVVLSRTDAPEINRTAAYYEICLNVTNALSWTNISLYDLSGDWINVSVHSGTFYYDYDSGTRQLGIFYGPATAGTDYIVAFDLTSSSVTLYLYAIDGTLLADRYISTNLLVGGDLDEIRFELQGSASNTLAVDYFFVLSSAALPGDTSDAFSLEPVQPDDLTSEPRIDIDPTSLTMEQSLRQELFGFENQDIDHHMTDEQLLEVLGQTDIHQQRGSGRMVAEGFKDLRDSIEDALIGYIADVEGVETDEIFLIDYYTDYIQVKVEIDNDVVNEMHDAYEKDAQTVVETCGGTLDDSVTATTLGITTGGVDNASTEIIKTVLYPVTFISDILRGIKDTVTDPFGLKDTEEWTRGKLDDVYQDIQDRTDLAQNRTFQLMEDWQRTTNANYQQVRQDFLNFFSVSQAQTAQLAADYKDMQDRFERTISKYYSYAENQFEASNAIIAKLLLQNEDFAEASRQANQYFAGQLTKSNEVLMNLTSSITSSLSAGDFWKGVFDDGKASSEPLTFSSFFGNNVRTWTYIIIGILITVLLVAVAIYYRPSKKHAAKRRS
jgi:hypothetical protein